MRGLCIATGQYSSLCVSAVVLILGGSDDLEVDEQDREQVDSETEWRRERERKKTKREQTTNAETRDDMCMCDFVRHALQLCCVHKVKYVEKKSRVRCICLHHSL